MRFVLIAATILVTGCETATTYGFREGATVGQYDRDSFECEVAATEQVPASIQVRSTPGYVTPVVTRCRDGVCYTTGGHFRPGRTYSYDANKPLRKEFYARCIAERGYQTVRLPACERSSVPPGLKQKLAGKLRPPKEGACVSRITSRAGNLVYPEELGN